MKLASLRRATAVVVGTLLISAAAYTPARADPSTGTIAGQVTRPDGSPAPSEIVYISDPDFEHPSVSGVTDADGRYSITGLVPDSYHVSILRNPLRQYAHGRTTSVGADTFAVSSGQITTVDERLLPVGTLELTVLEHTGAPADAGVSLVDLQGNYGTGGRTDQSGRVSLTAFAGSYKVQVLPAFPGQPGMPDYGRQQWVQGRPSAETADVVVVEPDAVTRLTERLLTPGSITVTARDSATGAPIADFCAMASYPEVCSNGTGTVTIANVRPGPTTVNVYTADSAYYGGQASVTVVGGSTVPLGVDLVRGATITTTVVDASTGAPVEGACVIHVKTTSYGIGDSGGPCSDGTGAIRIGPVEPGSYQLFVQPPAGSTYGAQWVGAGRGTGNRGEAKVLTVRAGAESVAPVVRLDRAGVITGVVTSETTGAPVTGGVVSITASSAGAGPILAVDIDPQGRYRIDWLGPYEWPLIFGAPEHAQQWSGGAPTYRQARRIRVRAGQTTTYDYRMRVGATVSGTVSDVTGRLIPTYVEAYNLAGEPLARGWAPEGTYRMLVLGDQRIKLSWYAYDMELQGWYDDDDDFAHARPVPVPRRGSRTVDIVIKGVAP